MDRISVATGRVAIGALLERDNRFVQTCVMGVASVCWTSAGHRIVHILIHKGKKNGPNGHALRACGCNRLWCGRIVFNGAQGTAHRPTAGHAAQALSQMPPVAGSRDCRGLVGASRGRQRSWRPDRGERPDRTWGRIVRRWHFRAHRTVSRPITSPVPWSSAGHHSRVRNRPCRSAPGGRSLPCARRAGGGSRGAISSPRTSPWSACVRASRALRGNRRPRDAPRR